MKRKFYLRGFLKDASLTILNVPIHLVMCFYAVGAQCVTQLWYDYKNNTYEVYNVDERQD